MIDPKLLLKDYAAAAKHLVLASIDSEGNPRIRTLASFAVDGRSIYVSTSSGSEKVARIRRNDKISVLFQHEGQDLKGFQNIEITGKARIVADQSEFRKAAALIAERSPRFKERLEKGEIGPETVLVRVDAGELRHLDFTRGPGPAAAVSYKL